jgi:hypothetical protein
MKLSENFGFTSLCSLTFKKSRIWISRFYDEQIHQINGNPTSEDFSVCSLLRSYDFITKPESHPTYVFFITNIVSFLWARETFSFSDSYDNTLLIVRMFTYESRACLVTKRFALDSSFASMECTIPNCS